MSSKKRTLAQRIARLQQSEAAELAVAARHPPAMKYAKAYATHLRKLYPLARARIAELGGMGLEAATLATLIPKE